MGDVYTRVIRARGQIVKALRREFPATKFRVRATANCLQASRDNKGLIFVESVDGPKDNEVEALASPFKNDIELCPMHSETCPRCHSATRYPNSEGSFQCVLCNYS
jgi:hypothetical protein